MKRPSYLVALSLVFFIVLPVTAQNPLLPPPGLPLVKRAPSQSTWTMVLSYPLEQQGDEAKDNSGKKILRITVQKDGTTLREQAFADTGSPRERWIFAGQEFVERQGRFLYVPAVDEGTDRFNYQTADFPRMEWLAMKYYRGFLKYEGNPVHLFVKTEDDSKKGGNIAGKMPQWIAQRIPFVVISGKQLPVLCYDGRVLARFSSFEPLAAELVPPENLSRMAAQLQADLKDHRRMPSPP